MTLRKTAIVVGSGAGGAVIAKELQGRYDVTILEAGKAFKPFSASIPLFSKLRYSGLFLDERMISMFIPNMKVEKTKDMVLVRGIGLGGTTTLATGNAVRCDGSLRRLGIDLDKEFEELYEELPITIDHQRYWTDTTRQMYELFETMGLHPIVTPKFLDVSKCVGCGHCAIGCPTGAKWDSRALVDEAVRNGAHLIQDCKVGSLEIEDGLVKAVHGIQGGKKVTYAGDLIVLAAGGLGTPVILEDSGIEVRKQLFVDPVLCVAGRKEGIHQERQILMPFISQREGYILSPYMDYLSFFFNKDWKMGMEDIVSIMIKLADEKIGSTDGKRIDKTMSEKDKENMKKAVALSSEIVEALGVAKEKQFLGTLNAGHPGGMLPLNEKSASTLHDESLPANLYIADATLFPESLGNPPILTIMALAKKIASLV